MTKLPFYEKVGYAMGDAAANLVWRGALAYLAVFYTDTFGLTAAAAAMLFLVVRLSDGISNHYLTGNILILYRSFLLSISLIYVTVIWI